MMIIHFLDLMLTFFKEVECPDPVSPQSGYIEVDIFIIYSIIIVIVIIIVMMTVLSPVKVGSFVFLSHNHHTNVIIIIVIIIITIVVVNTVITNHHWRSGVLGAATVWGRSQPIGATRGFYSGETGDEPSLKSVWIITIVTIIMVMIVMIIDE